MFCLVLSWCWYMHSSAYHWGQYWWACHDSSQACRAAVTVHYGNCPISSISAFYWQVVNNRRTQLSCGLDIIGSRTRCGLRALCLTRVVYMLSENRMSVCFKASNGCQQSSKRGWTVAKKCSEEWWCHGSALSDKTEVYLCDDNSLSLIFNARNEGEGGAYEAELYVVLPPEADYRGIARSNLVRHTVSVSQHTKSVVSKRTNYKSLAGFALCSIFVCVSQQTCQVKSTLFM